MIRAVLFDLDGTLLNTAPDLVGALNFVREHEGLPAVDWREFKHFASRGALGLIDGGLPGARTEQNNQRKAMLLEHYAQNIYKNTRPFDGIMDLIEALRVRAIPWGVVTNKPEYLTLPLLLKAGLSQLASCVICGDTLSHSKPHPAPVRLGCELLGVSSECCLMVGDDLRDLQAGKAAGTLTALAAYGYLEPGWKSPDPPPDWHVDSPSQLLDLIEQQGGPHLPV
ncbi:MAG: HAD-IA family hydrolase [Xanthomonadales bacterium]|nr:HAD-IA family hydrolase [Xanthomonadales bacterium]